ncbi:phosphotransferase [bacterium]|nr:phosphotransferase [bacterium]
MTKFSLEQIAEIAGGSVAEVEPLPADLSPRRYSRIRFRDGARPSLLFVELAAQPSPAGGGPRGLDSDEAFVEVHHFLSRHGIRVPEIFRDGREQGYLLLEDFGDRSLRTVLIEATQNESDPFLLSQLPPKKELLKQAVGVLEELQQLSTCHEERAQGAIIFERSPTLSQLQRGAHEFLEYVLVPRGIKKQESVLMEEFFEQLAEEILSHPKTVSHYDYMASNIHLLSDGTLGLIDFQDACLESPARDIHSLLCCRGMDRILGKALAEEALSSFAERSHGRETFAQLYREYSVLWDLRVSGRFTKLAHRDGRKKYGEWIEGTLARLLHGLELLTPKFERAGDLLEITLARVEDGKSLLAEKSALSLR